MKFKFKPYMLLISLMGGVTYYLQEHKNTKFTNPLILLSAGITAIHKNDNQKLEDTVKHIKYKRNIATNEGITLLIAAVIKDNKEGVKILLDNGADINFRNKNGETALMFSSVSNIKTTVFLLKQKEIDINIEDNGGNNFMHYLTINKNPKIINKLKTIEKYKNLMNKKNHQGMSPLNLQIQNLKFGK